MRTHTIAGNVEPAANIMIASTAQHAIDTKIKILMMYSANIFKHCNHNNPNNIPATKAHKIATNIPPIPG